MVERKPERHLRRAPREGELGDMETGSLGGRAVGVGRLREGFREMQESDEDA